MGKPDQHFRDEYKINSRPVRLILTFGYEGVVIASFPKADIGQKYNVGFQLYFAMNFKSLVVGRNSGHIQTITVQLIDDIESSGKEKRGFKVELLKPYSYT